jgi:hypothetical protein
VADVSSIVLPAGSVITWGALTATSGHYLYLGGLENAASQSNINLTRILVPRAGVFRNLWVIAGANTVFTLYSATLGATALTVSATANVVGSDLTHAIAVAAGDLITMRVEGTAGADAKASVEFV